MKTTTRPFQLEETVPGTFLLQGFAGGALGGFTYVVASVLWASHPRFSTVIFLTPFFMIAGAILGVFKASFMWGFYRLTGIRMGALARVAVASIGAFALATFFTLYFESDFANWLFITLAPAVPTALFVGSSIKPWDLFTFGSVVVDRERVGSGSVLATLGTLPLRLLCLIALALWLLLYSCGRPNWEPLISSELNGIIFDYSLVYLAISAYLTFRTPRKIILPAWGLLLNLYIFLSFLFFRSSYTSTHLPRKWIASVTLGTFLIAWAVFLVARLAAPTNEEPLTILPAASPGPKIVEHQCLGTRFLEWQKRVA